MSGDASCRLLCFYVRPPNACRRELTMQAPRPYKRAAARHLFVRLSLSPLTVAYGD